MPDTSAESRGWPGDVAVAGAARSAVLGLLRDWLNQTADER
jgi:hypothetical protein